MKGILKKKGGVVNIEWQDRYCVVSNKAMHYYISERHGMPQGVINLEGARVVNTTKKAGLFTFDVLTPLKKICFRTASNDELTTWIEAIQAAISGELSDAAPALSVEDLQKRLEQELLDKFRSGGFLLFERYHIVSEAQPNGKTVQKRLLQKKIDLPIEPNDISEVQLDVAKFSAPEFPTAVKLRPVVTIKNLDVVTTLQDHFKTLSEVICTESKATPRFDVGGGYVDNLLYDKAKCNKNNIRRKLGELFGGVCMMPINITLKEDVLRDKLERFENDPSLAQAHAPQAHPVQHDAVKNEPAIEELRDQGVIDLNKPADHSAGGGISLDKPADHSAGISLDKPVDHYGGGISLDKHEDHSGGISLEKSGGGISLDKPVDHSGGISLDKHEDQHFGGISLDKPSADDRSISLDKYEEQQFGGISLDKPADHSAGSGISLDKPVDHSAGGISLDKHEDQHFGGISLDKPAADHSGGGAISLEKPRDEIEFTLLDHSHSEGINLDKPVEHSFVEIDLGKH